MQSTTRSVEAVEGVAVAKAMASGGTVSPSASAGGKSSFVVNIGGGGRYNKRKGLPNGHSSISITLGQKKKLCSSASNANDVAKGEAIKGSGGGLFAAEKKESHDEVIAGDPSLQDAAKTLTEFFYHAHKPVPSSSTGHPSIIAALPQWKKTKLRSGRTKRLESSSNEDSHLVTAADSSNPSPLPVENKQLPQLQVSDSSSYPGGDSQSGITIVKVEDKPLCSISGSEGVEQVEHKKGESAAVTHDESMHRFPSDSDRLPKLASASSIESLQPDSRAESPISPLPAVLSTGELASIVPKLEGSSPTEPSAFQRVAPVRPVKKPAPSRKLKVEEKTFEDLNPEQAGVKHVSRKKPRPTGFLPQQQQQELPQQQPPLQQLACVKIEDGDVCALALGPPRLSAAEEAQVKRIGETSSIAPPSVLPVDENTVKLDPALVKVEIKFPGKFGLRGGPKVKPALSESEKEARKQRRVQANRESARLTIRKKQVLCEELTRKAELLTSENAIFREEVARFREKNKSMSEANAKLSEQVAKANGKHEPEPAAPPISLLEKPPDGMVHYHIPPPQFGGMPVAPGYVWAYALAQAAQAAGVQSGEIKLGSPDYSALFAATAAAAAACGNNPQAEFWSMASGNSQGQALMFPSFYRGHMSGASVTNTLSSSSGAPATVSAISRSVSLPVAPTDGSSSLGALERTGLSVKPVAGYRSGDFSDSGHVPHDLKRSATKQDSPHLGSGYSGRTHYFQMPSESHAVTAPATGLGTTATRKAGEGSCAPMSNTSVQLLGRSRSLSSPHVPKLQSRYPMFGTGGMAMALDHSSGRESEARRKGAAATEARRKRIELKRSKSLLKSRVAEPSAAQ